MSRPLIGGTAVPWPRWLLRFSIRRSVSERTTRYGGVAAWLTKPKELLVRSSRSIRSSTLDLFATCFAAWTVCCVRACSTSAVRKAVDIFELDALHEHALQDQARDRRGILDVPCERERALRHCQVVAVRDRLEIVELDLGELDRRLHPDMRLGQEVRVPIEPQGTCIEHVPLQVNVGGIRPLLGLDVPDILRGQVDPAQMQGLERAPVDIRHVTVTNPASVDLEVQI